MRRISILCGAIALCGCATSGPDQETLSVTPAGAEIAAWCAPDPASGCRQKVADRAQAMCRAAGKNAQYVRSSLMERDFTRGERWHFVYSCV